jgi:glycosyltransferase involved in cell wall biosynthesis
MNIVINGAVFDPRIKVGVGVYVTQLVRALGECFSSETFYVLIDAGTPNFVSGPNNVVPIQLDLPPRPSIRQFACQDAIRRQLRKLNADVYHLPNTAPLGRMPTPSLISILDLQEFKIRKYGLVRGAYRKWVNRLGAHRADRVITISENSKQDIVECLHVPEDKISVTHLAVSPQFRALEKAVAAGQIEKRLGLRDYTLAVGALHRGKNLARLLEAFAAIPPEACRHLALVGPTWGRFPELPATIRRLHLQGRVKLLGFVDDELMPALYAASKLLVYPSLYEGFGLPPLEAMACGTPVAASRNSSIPEVVGDAAILFESEWPDDIRGAMLTVLTDTNRMAELIRCGFERIRRFSWKTTAHLTMDAYRESMRTWRERRR